MTDQAITAVDLDSAIVALGGSVIAIGEDIATGEVVIRNYTNGTAVKISKSDIAGVAEMLREEFPQCELCEGTRVDGYCQDCGRNFDGEERPDEEEDEPVNRPGHLCGTEPCADCDTAAGVCCECCEGYEPGEVTL